MGTSGRSGAAGSASVAEARRLREVRAHGSRGAGCVGRPRAARVVGDAGVGGLRVYESLLLHVAVLTALPVATWWLRGPLSQAIGPVSRSSWGALAAVLLVEALLVTAWVPHNSWQTNMHGIGRIADVLDGGLLGASDMGRIHGMAWVVWMRLVHGLSGGWVSVPLATHLTALIGLVGLFVFLTAASRRGPWAIASVALLALHPIHLRLAASASPYVLVETALIWMLVWVEVHRQQRSAATWYLAAAWQAVLMQSHGEMLVLGPAIAGLYLLCREPAWVGWAVRRRWFWGGLLLVAAVIGPWLGEMLHAAFVGVDVFRASGDLGSTLGHDNLRTSALRTLFWVGAGCAPLALLVRVAVPRWRARSGARPWHDTALALGLLMLAAWAVPDPQASWAGLVGFQVTPLGSERLALARLHPFFDPTFGPDPLVPLAALGVAALAWWQPRLLVFLVGSAVGGLIVTVGHYDAISTYLRVSLPTLWMLCALAGAGLAALVRAAGAPRLAGALAVALALIAGRGHWQWVSHRFPMQQEEDLIFRARALPEVRTLATLLPSDRPEHPAAEQVDFDYRNYVVQALGRWRGGALIGADELLRRPVSEGLYWLKLPTCYRPVTARAQVMGSSSRSQSQVWWIEGRFMEVPRFDDGGPLDGPQALNPDTQLRYDLDALVPCRGRPASMRCAEGPPEDCARWVCTDQAPPDHPFIDGTCAQIEASFVLEPVLEERVAPGNLSRSQALVLDPNAVIGLYRVVARREGR